MAEARIDAVGLGNDARKRKAQAAVSYLWTFGARGGRERHSPSAAGDFTFFYLFFLVFPYCSKTGRMA